MFPLVSHRLRQIITWLTYAVDEHLNLFFGGFIAVVLVALSSTAFLSPVVGGFVFLGVVIAFITVFLLAFSIPSGLVDEYDPQAAATTRRQQIRKRLRREHPELRDINDDIIDELYQNATH